MDPSFRDRRLLVVGAGGIGCELLKNLVLTGFKQIEVIDLDTIELSNLNRQFLFQKHHVGKSKSLIARESVLKYPCSETNQTEITSHHDSVMNPKYSVDYFRNFALVLNALDNRAARSHVNRLCLAANVPLIESGSAGYLGQVTVISRGLTECYDCLPKAPAKTFPGCTIRNTPSEPIHCIVWAKHLFNQLFGAEDPDEAVSPDGEDPENMAEAGQNALANLNNDKDIKRVSTRQWAKETNYNSQKLFGKLFNDDIKYLLSMSKLWEKRRPPTPLEYSESVDSTIVPGINTEGQSTSSDFASLKVWTLGECVRVFERSVKELSARLDTETLLHWDKDDESALDFVASAANLRSAIFGIAQKSKFEVKSLAGNIIPAIASTNAIVAGLIVLQAIKVLAANMNDCRTVYLRDKPLLNKLIVSSQLEKPNPKCYVCASKPELAIKLDLNKFTIKQLETKILKQELNMVQPDVEIGDGSGRIIISSEEGETEENNDKVLSHFGITDQTRLKCDDFFQNYELVIVLHHCEKFDTATNAKDYEIVSDEQTVKDIQEAVQKETSKQKAAVEEEEKKREEVKKRKLDNNEDSNDEIIFEEDVVKQQRVSPSNQQKRSHEVAFSGENRPESTASVLSASHDAANGSSSSPDDEHASKKLRPDEENDDSNSINDASDVISDEEENNSNSISRPSISSLTNTTSSTAAHASSSTAAATTTGVMTSSRGGTDISKSTIVEEPDDDDVVIEDDDCIIEEEVSGDSNPNPNRSQQQQQQHRQMTIPVNFEDASVSSSEFISVNENGRKNGGESNTGREESSNTNGNNDEDDDVIECSGSESDEESGDEEEDDDALSSPMVPDEHLEREEDDDGDVIEIGDDDDSKQQQQ